MKLYPWLVKSYNNIIKQYKTKKMHHAILIKTQRGLGISKLIWFISKWILCSNPKDIHFCNQCHGCKLMSSNNHPDWHNLIINKNYILDVEHIRTIIEKVLKCPQQGQTKIIFVSDTEKFTESAINAFLKILEEPPENTIFFLINYQYISTHATLNSRCLIYKLFTPKEKDSLHWLIKKEKDKKRLYLTALRINQGSPISAKKFIQSKIWIDRINFYKSLYHAFKNKDLLKILPIFKEKNSIVKINWICLLLFDGIKFSCNEKKNLINLDQIEIVQFLSNNYTHVILDISIRTWMRCKYRLLNISGINHELLLLEQLLEWEKILNFIFSV